MIRKMIRNDKDAYINVVGPGSMKAMTKTTMFAVGILLLLGVFVQYANAELPEDQFVSGMMQASSEPVLNKRMELLEALYAKASVYQKYIILPKMSKTAIAVSEFSKAEEYAKQLLVLADQNQNDWNFGNAVHDANIVLGMVCLHNDALEEAKEHLLQAGHAPTSSQLKIFGPDMMLARALLDKGETEVVIEYLQRIKKVWEHDEGRLDRWIAAINKGGGSYWRED